MKLADARKLAIRDRISIRFPLPGGRECVVDTHGVARVPGLSGPPDFNLEQEFESATRFTLDPATPNARPRELTRQALEQLVSTSPTSPTTDDHDE
jgi:hypothetical protein